MYASAKRESEIWCFRDLSFNSSIRQRQHGQRPHGRIRVPCEELVSHTGEMIEAHLRYPRLCFPEPPPCFGIGLYAMTERKEAFSSEKLFCTQFP